jgi:nucleoside-diphosphate-sugar epimerase
VSASVVVGGSGFIGSRLAQSLARAGEDVTVLDVVPPPDDLSGVRRVESCDLAVPGSLSGAFDEADTVYLAGALLAKRFDEDPRRGFAVNVGGTVHALNEIVAAGRRPRVVFLSTGTVYASPAAHYPVAEDATAGPANAYAHSKLAGEQAVAAAAAAGAFPAVVVRLFTVYGPGPAAGERGHFVAGWISSAVEGRPVTVFGDGEQTVDLTHVSDVVAACTLAASAPIPAGACRAYNVGSGVETRVRDVARWMRDVIPSLEIVSVPPGWRAPGRQHADIRRARAELGYSPRVAPEAGVKALLRERLDRAARQGRERRRPSAEAS